VQRRLAARWPDVQTVWFGHVADSNIHIGVRGSEPLPESEVDVIVYDCVGEYAGSISAEHGIGTLKRAFLDRSRTAAELATMRLIKSALDPTNILNPGKILLPSGHTSKA
jgi:FAD/FMN-containing dehydrogenase